MKRKFDIVVVGAGISGKIMSLAAARQGFSVGLIDQKKIVEDTINKFDGRAYAIAFSSVQMLKNLDLWDKISKTAQPILNIKVSHGTLEGGPFSSNITFKNADIEESPMAQMVEDRYLKRCLSLKIKKNNLVEVIEQKQVRQIIDYNAKKQLILSDSSKIQASLVVASDGMASPLSKIMDIRKTGWRYKQSGLVCAVQHEYCSQNTAYQHFLPEGPLAILPLQNNIASIVWTENIQNASTISKMTDDEYLGALHKRFGDFLGQLKLTGKRSSFPLSLSIAEKYVTNNFAVIGDAAHGYHPIAGQGLNAGFRDIAALVDVITSARDRGENFSSLNVLNRYQEWRRFDNQTLGFATDNFNKFFSSYNPLLRSVRNFGMNIIDKSGYGKRAFMKQAAGLNGDLPTLMR
jgi:2-octaprenyl-6-methoxyphenol hydroxylase